MMDIISKEEYREDFMAVLLRVQFGGKDRFREACGTATTECADLYFSTRSKDTDKRVKTAEKVIGFTRKALRRFLNAGYAGFEREDKYTSTLRNQQVRKFLDAQGVYRRNLDLTLEAPSVRHIVTKRGLLLSVGYYYYEKRGGYLLLVSERDIRGISRVKRQFRLGEKEEEAVAVYNYFLECAEEVNTIKELSSLLGKYRKKNGIRQRRRQV